MTTGTYSHIIVGAGSAGCVLASRLSEDSRNSVLLLEAGGSDWNPLIRVPVGSGKLLRNGLHGWIFDTEPCAPLNGRTERWPRGRVIGGTSSINGMIYIRGHPSDYDHWRDAGNPGWGYDDVLPYFLKAEGHVSRSGPLHSSDGPLKVTPARSPNPLYPAFVEAGTEAGFPAREDFNDGEQEGFGRFDFTIFEGRRWSAARAYLDEAMKRPNLRVMTGARVRRVIFEGTRATGVELERKGTISKAAAAREVIVSAGSILSPVLLLHSGIGDPQALTQLGIRAVAALPGVGRHLQDHPSITFRWGCTEPLTLHSLIRVDRAAAMMARAMLFRTGPGASFPVEAGAFTRTRPDIPAPDIQWHFIAGLGLRTLRVPGINPGPLDREGFSVSLCQLRPDSHGTISLASPDPKALPKIDHGYLSAPSDMAVMRAAFAQAREVAKQPALQRYIDGELAPGRSVGDSDDEVVAWIRATMSTGHHQVGTCRMGTGPDAVVDPQLKVHGIEGLRVVDNSIMPRIVGGNTNAPTIMIAEKAADLMRASA